MRFVCHGRGEVHGEGDPVVGLIFKAKSREDAAMMFAAHMALADNELAVVVTALEADTAVLTVAGEYRVLGG